MEFDPSVMKPIVYESATNAVKFIKIKSYMNQNFFIKSPFYFSSLSLFDTIAYILITKNKEIKEVVVIIPSIK